jgi:hypothetical protein
VRSPFAVSFLFGLSLGAALFAARTADACCGAGYGLGQRLSPMESGMVQLGVGMTDRPGAVDAHGRYRGLGAGHHDRELRLEAAALDRVLPSLTVGAIVPALLTDRRATRAETSGGGLGDITAIVRLEVVPFHGAGGPTGLALTFEGVAPTGRSPAESKDRLGADVTGTGSWEARPGVGVEDVSTDGTVLAAAASVGIRTAHEEGTSAVAPAPRFRLVAAGGHLFEGRHSVLVGVLHEREAAPSIDGRAQPDAARARTAALLVGGFEIAAQLSLVLSASADVPLPGLFRNEPVARSFLIALRRSFTR